MAASYRFDLMVSLVRLIVVRRFFFTLAQQRAGSAFQFRQLVAHHVPDFFVIEAESCVTTFPKPAMRLQFMPGRDERAASERRVVDSAGVCSRRSVASRAF